jgi:hypothetical protein
LKETGFRHPESGVIVQALKALVRPTSTPGLSRDYANGFRSRSGTKCSRTRNGSPAGCTPRSSRFVGSSLMDKVAAAAPGIAQRPRR